MYHLRLICIFPLYFISFLLKGTHILGTLCDCDHIYPREQQQHKGEAIYFLHGFRGFIPWLLGLMYLDRTSWWLELMEEEAVHFMESGSRIEITGWFLKGMPPVIFLPPSLPESSKIVLPVVDCFLTCELLGAFHTWPQHLCFFGFSVLEYAYVHPYHNKILLPLTPFELWFYFLVSTLQ